MNKLIYGPVPSRRLGRSLGINNIPYKVCSYNCIYCQIGEVPGQTAKLKSFYNTNEVIQAVEEKLNSLPKSEKPDYLSLVPDGEPTLDMNLGLLIDGLKQFSIPIAVISNASMLKESSVFNALLKANYVSLKIDSVTESIWKKINRPHIDLDFNEILDSITRFAKLYKNYLVTETMFIKDYNDSEHEIASIAKFIKGLNVKVACLAVPTRPGACKNIEPADEDTLTKAYGIFSDNGVKSEFLTGYEGNEFSSTGNFESDIMSITAVHPMREDAVLKLLHSCNSTKEEVDRLLDAGKIKLTQYRGHNFYSRKFNKLI